MKRALRPRDWALIAVWIALVVLVGLLGGLYVLDRLVRIAL